MAIDQHVSGRYDLYKWLIELGGHENAAVLPVQMLAYVHDLRLALKRHGGLYPDDAAVKAEISALTTVDGVWFKAGVDRRRMRRYRRDYLQESFLDDILRNALETGSPIDFGRFEERYVPEPATVHVAGSGWGKKNPDVVLDVAETLYEQFGLRTVMTSMDPILDAFEEREFVTAYPEASRDTYERALRKGDIAICATDHETMARTWFEQAASGQVLVARDRPWIHDCILDDYHLLGELDELKSLAVWAVEHWEEAVAENRRLVEHVSEVRDPRRCGRRTHDDLRSRVTERIDSDTGKPADEAVEKVVSELDGERINLLALAERAGGHVGRASVLDRDGYTRTDLLYALRTRGWRHIGNSGTPIFERVR